MVSSLHDFAKFLEITGILKRIRRTGWVNIGVNQPESVADHTFRTAFLCMVYADMAGLNPLRLIRMALIHDLHEAVIGDLTPTQKTKEIKKGEKKAIQEILSLLPEIQREKYLEVWKEYQEGQTKEAKAVRQLEKIEMALQAKEYERLGMDNKKLERFITSVKNIISWPDLRSLLSYIVEDK